MEVPSQSTIKALIDRYAVAPMRAATEQLTPGDRQALNKLIKSGEWINQIYWKQRSTTGLALRNKLRQVHESYAELERLIDINFGPWDNLNHDKPFWGRQIRPLGGSFYPEDLTREEFLKYVGEHGSERNALLNSATLVERHGERLVAIPYSKVYKDELANISGLLQEAGDLVSDDQFRAFLHARARELPTDSLTNSEGLWVQAAGSPIDVAIGPYEVYDDALLGLKTSYEAIVMVLHPMTGRLKQFEALAPHLEKRLFGVADSVEGSPQATIGVYDLVYTAGMANMGSKAIAATLPNDEGVRNRFGSRLLLFHNVIRAKFDPILKPLAKLVLRAEQLDLVQQDAFLYHTLLHEMAHALSAGFVKAGTERRHETIHQALRELYSTIEESRADLVGLVFLDFLVDRGLLPPHLSAAAAVTFVVNNIRTLRFGGGEDHGRAAAIALSHLLNNGALKIELSGALSIAVERIMPLIGQLAGRIQRIAVSGDYAGARKIIEQFAAVPAEIESLMPRLDGIPTDLEFQFLPVTP